MKRLAVTQRVVVDAHGERRDALDQRWTELLAAVGFLGLPLPNSTPSVPAFMRELAIEGVILTGGNSLSRYGGDAPERDAVEHELLRYCSERRLPVLGVCRGMQMFHDFCGGSLVHVEHHVTPHLRIECNGQPRTVNSYHDFGFREACPQFTVWARSADQVIKAVHHVDFPWTGIMWHPERNHPFEAPDLDLIGQLFQ